MRWLPRRPDMLTIDRDRSTDRGLGVFTVVGDANVQGILAAGVPSTIRGLTDAQAAYGKLPLKTVMAPAIAAARGGFDADNY